MTRLIDKKCVLESVKALPAEFDAETVQRCIEVLSNQPEVDAVPVRHGKWKKIRGAINCSACKRSSWSMSFEDLVTSFNYCPNCGARMDE